jgi:hypothetical protein
MLAREMPVRGGPGRWLFPDRRLKTDRRALRGASAGKAVALDETAAKRGHTTVTIFIDLERKARPVVFATRGSSRWFATCRRRLAALGESFPRASVTVDWFHVVQIFARAARDVRKAKDAAGQGAVGCPLGGAEGQGAFASRRSRPPLFGQTGGQWNADSGRMADQGDVALGPKSRLRCKLPAGVSRTSCATPARKSLLRSCSSRC